MRPRCGVLLLSTLLTVTGHAQAPNVPTGSGRISGRIITSASEPVGDAIAVLGLAGNDGPLDWQAWWSATTDAEGFYEFDALPSGRFTVIAVKEGFAGWQSIPTAAPGVAGLRMPAVAFATNASRLTIELVPGGRPSNVNLTLFKPATLSGRALRPDGSPAPDTRMMLYTVNAAGVIDSSRTSPPADASGAYSFSDLGPGTFYVGVLQHVRVEDIDRATLTPVTIPEGVSARNIDIPVFHGRGVSITGRIADALGGVPRELQLEYGTPGATHRGLLSSLGPDGTFEIVDREITPGPVTLMARGNTDDGPVAGLLNVALIDGPNEIDVVVGKPGAIRGRVTMEGGVPLTAIGVRLALVREGFQPLGESDQIIEVSPDGWLEAADLIGEYRLRVDEPQRWTVKSVRRRGIRLANDRLIVRIDEMLDDVEIVIGPR